MNIGRSKKMREWYEEMKAVQPPAEIERAMQALKPGSRKVINLYYEQNMTVAEIAAHINKSASTVWNYQWDGMYTLYKYFNKKTGGSGPGSGQGDG